MRINQDMTMEEEDVAFDGDILDDNALDEENACP